MAVGGDAPTTKNINPYRLATEAEYHLFRPEWVGKNDDWVTADGGDQCAANDVNSQVRSQMYPLIKLFIRARGVVTLLHFHFSFLYYFI